MEDLDYEYDSYEDDYDHPTTTQDNNFHAKFEIFKQIVSSNIPTSSFANPSSREIPESVYQIQSRKTSNNARRKKTPSGTRKPRTSIPESSDTAMTDKIKDRLKSLVHQLALTRPWLPKDQFIDQVFDFCSRYKITFPKGKDKQDQVILYCIIMTGRLNGFIFDSHILSMDLEMKLKDVNNLIVENVPSFTSENNDEILNCLVDIDKTQIVREYTGILKTIVEEFSSQTTLSDLDVETYSKRSSEIFELLDRDENADYERQFCVTPDKVYIYCVFELIKEKNKDVTERSICDYLAGKFKIPRVTIEKMKRLVLKSSRAK